MRWLLSAAVVGAALAGVVGGASAADDVHARVSLERAGAPPLAGQTFRVVAAVESVGGDNAPFDYTLTVTIDPGLELIRIGQEFNPAACERAGQTVTCRGTVIGRDISQSYQLDLRAARPGTYGVQAALVVAGGVDLDPTDNSDELSIEVGAAPATVSAFRMVPARPVAGRPFVATLLLARAAAPVRPTAGTCRATIAGRTLRAKRTLLAGGVRCSWAVGRSVRGKRLVGSVSATADGTVFVRRFASVVR